MPFVKREYEYYKYIYEDYTLPTMTSNTAPEGLVESDVSISGGYATQIYPLFFNNRIVMNAYANRTSGRYIKYTFKNLLLPDTYSFEYVFGTENNVTVQENRWEVIYDDDTSEEILNALNEKSATKTATFTTKKCIKAIKLNLYISAPSDQYCYMTINSISLTSQGKEKNTVKMVTNTYMVNLGGEDVYEDWQQPVLSANNSSSILTVSATNEGQGAAWKVFDDDTNSEWATANNVTSGTLTAVLNKDIYITSIEVTGLQNQYGSTNTIAIYSDTNKQNVIGEQKSFDYSTSNTLIWNFEEPIKANTLVFYGIGTTWVVIRNIKITAQTLKAVGGNDYDYYINHNKLYQLARRKRTYYKYGTELDATVVGSFARIDKGVASGFSASQYLTYPVAFNISTADSWEMECKFTTSSNITAQQQILASSIFTTAGNSCGAFIRVYSSKIQFIVPLTSNISSYISLEYTATINTEYVVKGEFTGTAYNLYVNGELVATKESTSKGLYNASYNDRLYIGTATTKDCPLLGSIDLSQSYININGERWWSGDSYTKVGSWIDDGVVSGFTTANYLTLPELFRPASNPWERVICFTTSGDVATVQQLNYINYASDSVAGVHFHINSGKIGAQISSNGSSWNIAETFLGKTTLSTNATYYAMIRFTGSEYQLLLSTTGEFNGEETLENSLTSSTPIYQANTVYDRLGFRSSSIQQVFLGSMDLSKCYGKINGESWWHGTKVIENTKEDYDYYTDKNIHYDIIVKH